MALNLCTISIIIMHSMMLKAEFTFRLVSVATFDLLMDASLAGPNTEWMTWKIAKTSRVRSQILYCVLLFVKASHNNFYKPTVEKSCMHWCQ